MTRSTALRISAPLLVTALAMTACSSSGSTKTTSSNGGTTTTAVSLAPATLNGSGSTFQKTYDDDAVSAFVAKHAGVTINYNATGSGQGQTDLENEVVDFAGSDVPVAAADMTKLKGGTILYFPTVAGPITVAYHLSGVSRLQLSGPTVAQIFSRKIKTWNAAPIAADNPGVSLPSTAITVVHRSDGSGTTANFTKFLTKEGGASWTLGTGKTVTWSADTQAGKGNPGVASIVKGTDGAVGYVDFSDASASGLSFASIKNKSGSFVAPSLDSASAAVAGATVNADLTYDPIDASGATAYPITSPTYVIVYAKQTDPAKAAALKAFLQFVLGPDGQGLAAQDQFAKLSSDLDQKALAQVDQITAG